MKRWVTAAIAGVAFVFGAACAHAAEPIVLGQVGPFTGIPVPDAREISQGVTAYVAQANRAGGLKGRKLEYFEEDDKYSPDGFEDAFKSALRKKPLALVSPVGSAALSRMMKDHLLDDADVVVMNAVPGAATLRNPGHPKLFHVRAGDREQVARLVNHARTLGMTKIAALYQELPVGTSAMHDTQEEVDRVPGMTVTGVKSGGDPAQMAAAAATVAKLDAQAVLVLGAPRFMADGVAALRKAGVARAIFVRSDVPPSLIVKLAGLDGARGVGIAQNYPNPNGVTLPIVREFKAAMKVAHPEIVDYTPFQFEGYLSARVIGEAIRRAPGREVTPASLQRTLHAMKEVDFGGFRVNFADGQEGGHWVDIAVIGSDGRLQY